METKTDQIVRKAKELVEIEPTLQVITKYITIVKNDKDIIKGLFGSLEDYTEEEIERFTNLAKINTLGVLYNVLEEIIKEVDEDVS